MSVNKVEIEGRIGNPPELRTFHSGSIVANFSIGIKEGDGMIWFRAVAWGALAEAVGLLEKGTQVHILGRLNSREWEDKKGQKRNTVEIVASEVNSLAKTP